MIHKRNFAHAVAIGVMVFMGAAPASANAILRDLDRSGMVQGDVNIMMRSAASLYSEGRGKVGDEVSWKNPNTRADGNACASLQAQGGRARPRATDQTLPHGRHMGLVGPLMRRVRDLMDG